MGSLETMSPQQILLLLANYCEQFLGLTECPCENPRVGEDGWVYFNVKTHCTNQPCPLTMAAHNLGFYRTPGGDILWPAYHEDVPPCYNHGTSVQGLMGVLREGVIRSFPDPWGGPQGVYSYACLDRSTASTYVQQGVQLRFENPSIPVAKSHRPEIVPPGMICRQARSVHRKWEQAGWEWIHNPQSIKLCDFRVRINVLLPEISVLRPAAAISLQVCNIIKTL